MVDKLLTLAATSLLLSAPSGQVSAQAPAQTTRQATAPAPLGAPADTFAVRCGTLHTGDGKVQRDAWLIVTGGRIERITTEAAEVGERRVIDASDKVVMPGLVVADTGLAAEREANYNVTPDLVALDGFDLVRKRPRALAGGVTTVYLSPGRKRLISGQGSVVKSAGNDTVRRVLSERACLRVTLGAESTVAPALFEPTLAPTDEDPLLPARKQVPTARLSQMNEVRRLFRAALDSSQKRLGPGAAENRYDASALIAAAGGELPLRIAARDAADLRRGLEFAATTGSGRLVLEDPWDIAKVADRAAELGAGVVVRVPVRPGAHNPDADPADDAPHNHPENAAIAARAGLRVALAPARDEDLGDMLLVAAIAVRHGLDPEVALRAITSDAARVLGVDQRVGTLTPGKDADFLVLSGPPLAIGTMVEQTWIDGARTFERTEEATLLAVRAETIMTATGETIRDGVLLVENGKIKAVGTDLAIPFGARVLDCGPGGVMVPGFIDAYSHLGLVDEDNRDVPKGAADQVLGAILEPDHPSFAAARSAGLTTALVSGRDDGKVSGRVTAVKTAAKDRSSMVLREIAGIRMVHDDVSVDGIKSLSDQIDRGKSYVEKWQRYEKALADWKAGKGEKPILEEASTDGDDDPISGVWECEIYDLPFPIEIGIVMSLQLNGSEVSGEAITSIRGQERPPTPVDNGRFENGTLSLEVRAMRGASQVEAQVDDDRLDGTFGSGRFSGKIRGERTSADASSSGSSANGSDDGTPRKPRVDEKLEPLRALLEKRIPAIVRVDRAPAIEAVAEYFAKQDLPFLLTGLRDAIATPELFGDKRPSVILDPQIVRRERGEVVNAASVMAERGHPTAIGTGDAGGSRYLPVHAAMAVRYGMSPSDALEALTIHPARMFGLADRVGSLERGKDADFVVFAGNPFEMTSRVQLVVIDGRVVVDQRKDGK